MLKTYIFTLIKLFRKTYLDIHENSTDLVIIEINNYVYGVCVMCTMYK